MITLITQRSAYHQNGEGKSIPSQFKHASTGLTESSIKKTSRRQVGIAKTTARRSNIRAESNCVVVVQRPISHPEPVFGNSIPYRIEREKIIHNILNNDGPRVRTGYDTLPSSQVDGNGGNAETIPLTTSHPHEARQNPGPRIRTDTPTQKIQSDCRVVISLPILIPSLTGLDLPGPRVRTDHGDDLIDPIPQANIMSVTNNGSNVHHELEIESKVHIESRRNCRILVIESDSEADIEGQRTPSESLPIIRGQPDAESTPYDKLNGLSMTN